MKDFEKVKLDMNNSFSGCYERNRLCLDDYEFAVVEGAMWKGSYAKQFANKPKPEINQVFGAINRLLGQKQRLEMNAKIISNSEDATDEDADLLQSRWRNDFQSSDGVEAINNSDQEAFFSGFGAFKLVAKYEDEEEPDPEKQYLCVEPVMSAAASVVFSPSLKKDKSDSKQCWHIIRTNYDEVKEEYGDDNLSSINAQVDWFDWQTDSEKDIYLAHYYEVVEKRITEHDFGGYIVTSGDGIRDSEGNKLTRQDLEDLKEANPDYEVKRKKRKFVEYSLMSGSKFLTKPQRMPFNRVPVFPQYGYYSVINGIEYYCGEVRKRRDPQMFFNTFYSSLMEIMAAPQVEKPEYAPEQIARHAGQRARADIDNVPYTLSDPIKNPDGSIAQLGPIGKQMPPQIGSGLATAGQQLQGTLMDMSGSGQTTLPSNAAADAVRQVNERQDDTFQPLMQNSMSAIKAACEAWICAAQRLYFSNQRSIRVQSQDGSYSQVKTLEYMIDDDGNFGPYKNSCRGKYSAQVKIGESFKSQKEAELETNLKMLQFADTNTPQGQMILNQAIMSTSGEGGADARKVARYQMLADMLVMGVNPGPENDEEKEFLARKAQEMEQAAQSQQQDPAFVLEKMKIEENMLRENNRSKQLEIEVYKLKQKDSELGLKAQSQKVDNMTKAVDIDNKQADTAKKWAETEKITGESTSQQIDNIQKVTPQVTVISQQ